MKKVYHLYQDGKHEYTIKVKESKKGTKYTLYHSNGDQWTELAKGEKIAKLIDDGNGVSIKGIDTSYMDYSTEDYLRILLNFNNEQSHYPSKYEVVDATDTINV